MLEQRSEILSHYHRLDFFFFQAVTSAYFQKLSTNSRLPDDLLQQIMISGPYKPQ